MRIVLAAVVILAVLPALTTLSFQATAAQKVNVCHIPGGNPDNAHEIQVSGNAVNAHLGHGDVLGSCVGVAPTETSAAVFVVLLAGLAGWGLLRRRYSTA